MEQNSTNKKVVELIKKNNIPQSKIEAYKMDILLFTESDEICSNCSGIKNCKLNNKGYNLTIDYDMGQFYVESVPCRYFSPKVSKMNCSIEKDVSEDIIVNSKREELLSYFKKIIDKQTTKGVYISGSFGSGKTYLLLRLASSLKKNGTVEVLSFPSLVNEIKNSIKSGSFELIVTKLKTTDYLLLDDFNFLAFDNKWLRDEIFYSIFEYRIANNKLTCFTSNYEFVSLDERSKDSKLEMIDNLRLLERIKELSTEIYLSDINYRNESDK